MSFIFGSVRRSFQFSHLYAACEEFWATLFFHLLLRRKVHFFCCKSEKCCIYYLDRVCLMFLVLVCRLFFFFYLLCVIGIDTLYNSQFTLWLRLGQFYKYAVRIMISEFVCLHIILFGMRCEARTIIARLWQLNIQLESIKIIIIIQHLYHLTCLHLHWEHLCHACTYHMPIAILRQSFTRTHGASGSSHLSPSHILYPQQWPIQCV